MFFHEDWFMRQIEMLLSTIIHILSENKETQESEQDLEVRWQTEQLLDEKDICAAENYLFEKAEQFSGNPVFLKTALDFYSQVNKISDEELEQHNFSRGEIYDGIKEMCRINGIDDTIFYIIDK